MDKLNLEHNTYLINKTKTLWDTSKVRHGIGLVGSAFSAKSTCYQLLQHSMKENDGMSLVSTVIYPKTMTLGQLYGYHVNKTKEWADGLITNILRTYNKRQAR